MSLINPAVLSCKSLKINYFTLLFGLVFAINASQAASAQSDYQLGLDAYQNKNFPKARAYWENSAADDNLSAIFNLGILLSKGIGGRADPERAANLFRRSGDAGLAMGQHNLALAYYTGNGVREDKERAQIWWERAAKQGHTKAQFNLGVMLWNGDGVPKQSDEAAKWFRKASNAGDAQAQAFLEAIFDQSSTLARSKPEAQSDSPTQATITSILANADVAFQKKDYTAARSQWEQASKLGSARAAFRLAHLYREGLGVSQNLSQAFEYTERSAKTGLAQAQYLLAKYYFDGTQAVKNETLALYWMQSAADNNHIKAKDYLEQAR